MFTFDDLKDLLKFISVFVIISMLISLLVIQTVKILNQGTEITEGKLVSYSNSLTSNCVKVSQSKIGESAIEIYCSFLKIKNVPNLGENIKLKKIRSPFLLMDRIEINPKRLQ